jgi:hypothetical protein
MTEMGAHPRSWQRKTIALLLALASTGLAARTIVDATTGSSAIADVVLQIGVSILGVLVGIGFWRTDV